MKEPNVRWAYVTVCTTDLDSFPEKKADAARKLLLRAGFVMDKHRDPEFSHDGREMDKRIFFEASPRLLKGSDSNWVARVRRTAYGIFEREHAALTWMSVATRDGDRVCACSWRCMRRSNLQIRENVGNAETTGARMVMLGKKKRPLVEEEHSYCLKSERAEFLDSYSAAHYMPQRFVDSL